jgi:hypothetical protein
LSWLSDAHAERHHVNGRYAVCPLDCGVGEVYDHEDYDEDDQEQGEQGSPTAQPSLLDRFEPVQPRGLSDNCQGCGQPIHAIVVGSVCDRSTRDPWALDADATPKTTSSTAPATDPTPPWAADFDPPF